MSFHCSLGCTFIVIYFLYYAMVMSCYEDLNSKDKYHITSKPQMHSLYTHQIDFAYSYFHSDTTSMNGVRIVCCVNQVRCICLTMRCDAVFLENDRNIFFSNVIPKQQNLKKSTVHKCTILHFRDFMKKIMTSKIDLNARI